VVSLREEWTGEGLSDEDQQFYSDGANVIVLFLWLFSLCVFLFNKIAMFVLFFCFHHQFNMLRVSWHRVVPAPPITVAGEFQLTNLCM
jgi:hypothetical protein